MAAINTSQAKALIIIAELAKIGIPFSFSRPGETESAIGHRIEVTAEREPLLRLALDLATARTMPHGLL